MGNRFLKILSLFFFILFPIILNAEAAVDPAVSSKLTQADNAFGFNLFSQLNRENFAAGKKPQNIFFSPASIAWAFHMLLNGASGKTLEALNGTLALQGLDPAAVNAADGEMLAVLENADPQVQLSIANSLWGKEGLQFLPAFLGNASQFFRAKLGPLKIVDPINAWVSEKTKGKITSILKPEDITPQSILFLINALYFKGTWEKPFEKSDTRPEPFHFLDGTRGEKPLMRRSGSMAYYEDPQVQAVELRYGNGLFSLYVLLPKPTLALKDFLQGLDAARFAEIVDKRVRRTGSLKLPRFKIEYAAELAKPLERLGMALAFSSQADFSKLATVPPGWWIQINSVKHKTYVEVNEEGTEAASATAIGMMAGSAMRPPETPFNMVVDRPFFAAIRDNRSGLLLFMGAVLEP